jgi:hypothetical protein
VFIHLLSSASKMSQAYIPDSPRALVLLLAAFLAAQTMSAATTQPAALAIKLLASCTVCLPNAANGTVQRATAHRRDSSSSNQNCSMNVEPQTIT